jgi:drug/metabolite transporter (DMT)-like permease
MRRSDAKGRFRTPPDQRSRRRAITALFCGAAAIASSALFVKVSEAGPVSTAFWRVFLALPILWSAALYDAAKRPHTTTRSDLRLMALAGFCFAADLGVWHWSIVLTSVANATLLANVAPIFVTLAAWVVLRRAPRAQFLTGLAISIAGMFMLLGGDYGSALVGDVLGLVTALFYAGYQLTVTRARRTLSTARIMAVSATVTALILLPVALFSGERFVPGSTEGWLVLVALAVIAHAAGQSLIAYAMAQLSATFTSMGLLLQPVIAAVLGWTLLGEALTASAIAGAVLMLVGIRVAHLSENRAGT